MKKLLSLSVFFFIAFCSGAGQQVNTENTLTLGEAEVSQPATLEVMAWLAGHWKGDAFGGEGEEWWSEPKAGAMMGVYRVVSPRYKFYEILTITEKDGSLILRLKHFNLDLTGWEEKEETVDFPFIKVEGDRIYFDGWTFERIDDDHFRIFLAITQKDGAPAEVEFLYARAREE